MKTQSSIKSRPRSPRAATTSSCSSGTARKSRAGRRYGVPHCRSALLWSEDSRRAITKSLGEFAPDVVHIHNLFPLVTPSVLYACRDASVPVVATVHNYKLGCASGTLFRDGRVCHDCLGGSSVHALAHGCYRGSAATTAPVVFGSWLHRAAWRTMITAYIFISAAQRDTLAPVGLPADRSFVKHNFVPTPPLDAEITTERQVVYVGRLDEAKGASFLMRAWDAFRARHSRSALRLVVVGGGDMLATVASWATRHSSVRIAGQVSRPEVSRILAASRAVIVPSQWEETFGMAAVEAMAVGTPPVASAHGAFPELVSHGFGRSALPAYRCRRSRRNPRRHRRTTRSGGKDTAGKHARRTQAVSAQMRASSDCWRSIASLWSIRSNAQKMLAGPSARSSFGVPT